MACGKRFTYDGDPASSPQNEVRFLIGDTVRERPMFDDNEILWQLTQTPNPHIAGAELLEIAARRFARLADEKVGDVSRSCSQIAKQMRDCAKELRSDAVRLVAPFFGGLTHSGKRVLEQDCDAVQPAFSLGITDHYGTVQLNRDLDDLWGRAPGVF